MLRRSSTFSSVPTPSFCPIEEEWPVQSCSRQVKRHTLYKKEAGIKKSLANGRGSFYEVNSDVVDNWNSSLV